ncbi:MAG: hypothetical protein QOE28_1008 [Solirubrobacteraceae bacterium]|jgi:hypothetical protein|nr:hypothetical protein [Solirubrobacteraceae bacterium]
MTRRFLGALRSLVADPAADAAVHFHNDGLNGEPSACFDARCNRPAISI